MDKNNTDYIFPRLLIRKKSNTDLSPKGFKKGRLIESFQDEENTDYKDSSPICKEHRKKILSGDFIGMNKILSETEFLSDKKTPIVSGINDDSFFLKVYPDEEDEVTHIFDYINNSGNLYKHRDENYGVIAATYKNNDNFGINIYFTNEIKFIDNDQLDSLNRLNKYLYVTNIKLKKDEKKINYMLAFLIFLIFISIFFYIIYKSK